MVKKKDGIKNTVEEFELFEVSVFDKTPAILLTSMEVRGEKEKIFTETERKNSMRRSKINRAKTRIRPRKKQKLILTKIHVRCVIALACAATEASSVNDAVSPARGDLAGLRIEDARRQLSRLSHLP